MDAVDSKIEEQLWQHSSAVLQCILNHAARTPTLSQWVEPKITDNVYIGKYCSHWCIGDNENLFSCNRIIGATEDDGDFYRDARSGVSLHMFKPIDELGQETANAVLKSFFRSGNYIQLVKSRWLPSGKIIVKECRSLLDACRQLDIDVYKLLIELDIGIAQ